MVARSLVPAAGARRVGCRGGGCGGGGHAVRLQDAEDLRLG